MVVFIASLKNPPRLTFFFFFKRGDTLFGVKPVLKYFLLKRGEFTTTSCNNGNDFSPTWRKSRYHKHSFRRVRMYFRAGVNLTHILDVQTAQSDADANLLVFSQKESIWSDLSLYRKKPHLGFLTNKDLMKSTAREEIPSNVSCE